jgi:hypothetical protein
MPWEREQLKLGFIDRCHISKAVLTGIAVKSILVARSMPCWWNLLGTHSSDSWQCKGFVACQLTISYTATVSYVPPRYGRLLTEFTGAVVATLALSCPSSVFLSHMVPLVE